MKLTVLEDRGGLPVLDGAGIFRLVDSHGLPLEMVLQDYLFDVPTFCQAAKASGNYTRVRLWSLFREAWLVLGVVEFDGSEFARKLTISLDSLWPATSELLW